eukprot:360152-Chlamydomonas_euryale.AAC.2
MAISLEQRAKAAHHKHLPTDLRYLASRLYLVDLAGSERVKDSGSEGVKDSGSEGGKLGGEGAGGRGMIGEAAMKAGEARGRPWLAVWEAEGEMKAVAARKAGRRLTLPQGLVD